MTRLEVLYFEGCPNHEPLMERLPGLLDRAGVEAEIELTRVESPEQAERVGFLGSPTLRIDGEDVDPGAEARTDFGLKCRLFATREGLRGLPPDDWILGALARRRGGARPPAP